MGNMSSLGSPYVAKSKLRAFLKIPLQRNWEIAQPEQQPAKNNYRVGNRTLSIKRTPGACKESQV